MKRAYGVLTNIWEALVETAPAWLTGIYVAGLVYLVLMELVS